MTHYRPLRFVDGYRGDDHCSLVGVDNGTFRGVVVLGAEGKAKKCGAESSDPNRHSQPRLPGSVV